MLPFSPNTPDSMLEMPNILTKENVVSKFVGSQESSIRIEMGIGRKLLFMFPKETKCL